MEVLPPHVLRNCAISTLTKQIPSHFASQPGELPRDLPTQLANLLHFRKALIIVDDVWCADDVFGKDGLLPSALGMGSRVVLTGAYVLFF